MKVITALDMASIEALAIKEGASDEKFMQNAAEGIFHILDDFITNNNLSKNVTVIAGKGNNAGDGYVAALLLLKNNYNVKVFQLFDIENASKLCKLNHDRFIQNKGKVKYISSISEIDFFDENEIILDGIFGTGFKGKIEGFLLDVIRKINSCNCLTFSIDIPSGLNGDTGKVGNIAIKADYTIYLGLPKLGFFLNDGPNYIGRLKYVDFGLKEKYINLKKGVLNYMDNINLKELLPKIDRKRHKYEAGFVAGLSGSKGMYGAAKLAALAALRTGSGIVKMITEKEIFAAPYEIVNILKDFDSIEEILEVLNISDCVFVGPGLGRGKKIEKLLEKLLPKITTKLVLDADGLHFLSNNTKCLLPKLSVLTPHKKEMLKLLNIIKIEDEKSLFDKTNKFCQDHNLIIVLKGYPTTIFHPQKDPVTILGGDPGLATAGTGDVLTGMIASFISQKLLPYDAAILAVKMHFLAGEIAALDKTSFCLIASDVIEYLPKAFKKVLEK
ncbi:MAG: NAD(P)H-hydrate dehydratase [Parachlamydiales bacterium]|nr:NAD(P)H-hydrate dehydratase [Parachlamydiales bacterium]